MKNLITKIFSVTILSIFSLSCQEDFNPKTDFKEQYVLNCYIDLVYDRYMNTQIYATVSKLYNVDGFDPSQNKIDPSISGAEIYLNYRDILYKLQEDTNKTVITKYGTNQIYYYANLQNIYPSYNVSLTAKMPDGKVLTAQTQLLEAQQFTYSYDFRNDFTTKINRFYWGDAFTISWITFGERLFIPRIIIEYDKFDANGQSKLYRKEVPFTFVKKQDQMMPVYPTFTTGSSISFDYSAIDSAMVQISQGDNNKQRYAVYSIQFQWIEMDLALSRYFESINGSIDQYSISLDQSIYSNVKGGLGIFGSKRTEIIKWWLDSTYVRSFGYQH
ncbi:MAG: DUF4249 domain-containing protein [Bacteroidetes bacterium]|nr:DUF4249 domain-containing protein [Bacteroidota bacterium]